MGRRNLWDTEPRRIKCLEKLKKGEMTPEEAAKELNISVSNVRTTLGNRKKLLRRFQSSSPLKAKEPDHKQLEDLHSLIMEYAAPFFAHLTARMQSLEDQLNQEQEENKRLMSALKDIGARTRSSIDEIMAKAGVVHSGKD